MVFFHRRLSHSSRDQLGYYEILCRGDNLFKYWGLLSTFPGLLSTTYKVCIIHHQKVYCGYTADNHNGQLLLWAHLVEMETAVRGWKGYWNRHSQINGPNHNSFFISPSFFIHSIWLSILIKTCDYINICVFFTPVRFVGRQHISRCQASFCCLPLHVYHQYHYIRVSLFYL